jgi:hypothetical protein
MNLNIIRKMLMCLLNCDVTFKITIKFEIVIINFNKSLAHLYSPATAR